MRIIFKYLLRSLCFLIDYILVIAPMQFVFLVLFSDTGREVNLLVQSMFVIYNICFLQIAQGQTLGKKIGRLKVVSQNGEKPSFSEYGIREVVKGIYLVPVFGWIVGFISFMIMILFNGNTIHDHIAGTKVLFYGTQEELDDKPKR